MRLDRCGELGGLSVSVWLRQIGPGVTASERVCARARAVFRMCEASHAGRVVSSPVSRGGRGSAGISVQGLLIACPAVLDACWVVNRTGGRALLFLCMASPHSPSPSRQRSQTCCEAPKARRVWVSCGLRRTVSSQTASVLPAIRPLRPCIYDAL